MIVRRILDLHASDRSMKVVHSVRRNGQILIAISIESSDELMKILNEAQIE